MKTKLVPIKPNLSTMLQRAPSGGTGGGPLLLPLDLIDEDPEQPRTADNPGFSPESIAEIGGTIELRGVKTPISVRSNVNKPGHYLINHGARRYRGSRWAKKKDIPAFIDEDYNSADQVVENLQRNGLTAREIADYIGRELAKGRKKGQIAAGIGKSASFISQHVALLDLPEPIAVAFNSGRCADVTTINELVTAHSKNPEEVVNWLSDDNQEISRGSVKLLREFLEEVGPTSDNGGGNSQNDGSGNANNDEGKDGEQEPKPPKDGPKGNPDTIKKAIIQVQHDERPARILLTRRPPAEGFAWLKYDDDGSEFEANLMEVKLVAVVEG